MKIAGRMKRFQFELHLSPEQYLDFYRGVARQVLVRCSTGQTLQFPAAFLQRFVTQAGIHGRFELFCDEHHKCVELKRLDRPAI